MTSYTAETLDLSRIGAPTLTDIDYEATLKARLLSFKRLWDAARVANSSLPVLDLIAADGSPLIETDPAIILSEEFAYGEIVLKQALNDHANALRLATAVGADLDHLAQTYKNTPRLVLAAATTSTAAVYEPDTEYRERAQLSDEAMPLYGITPGGYIWRVRSLFGDRVKGVRALRRAGGHIDLIILAREGDGTPADTLIGDIQARFDGEEASQSTDIVTVKKARIVRSAVRVVAAIPPGPEPAAVIAAATVAIAALGVERHAIGETLHVQAIGAVAKVGPVRHVRVIEPAADLVGGDDGAPYVTSIVVDTEVET
jgi:phage-related baseplate assembly protein